MYFVPLILPSRCAHSQQGVPLFTFSEIKNSTTSGQFSRKCFPPTACRQLEMLRNRLTAESGGLGRRLFDQGWLSSEIFFTLFLLFPHAFLFLLPTLSISINLTLSLFNFRLSYSHKSYQCFGHACSHLGAPRQEVAVLHSWDKWENIIPGEKALVRGR